MEIAVDVYRTFKDSKQFSLRDQILKSGLSIPSNIAEGFERGNDKEFSNFLRYAKGSAGETRTQLIFAKKIGLIDEEICICIINKIIIVSKQIQALRNSIDRKIKN